MKKLWILSYLIIAVAFANLSPAIAKSKNIRKKTTVKKAFVETRKTSLPQEIANPLYPAKYTKTHIEGIQDEYKTIGKEEIFYVALDMLKGTNGEFSRNAILGNNLTKKPIKVEFRDLGTINPNYKNYDALGWKRGSKLYIYINQKHSSSPAIAIASLLSHEALHQDEYNSLTEETYAWTMEVAVWCELLELYPSYELPIDSLVQRENTLKKLFEKGGHTDKYIKKTVYSNAGYQDLPETSPGFEAL